MSAFVLHVTATLDRGGTEVTALGIAREFACRGFANRVLALEAGGGAITKEFEAIGAAPTVLPIGRVARALALYRLAAARRPDAILFHIFNVEHVVLGAAARLSGVKSIVAVLGNPVAADAALARKVRWIVHMTDRLGIRVVTASRWIQQSLLESSGVPRDVRVIHNGCDVHAIGARADAARAARVDCAPEMVVGMVSRLDPIKDHETLLAAFAQLPRNIGGRQLRLVLVGEGPLRKPLEAQARRLGIAERTTFTGARDDVPEAIANFDVFAFSTTRDEGFGVVLIEALAAGIPIVASDVAACREVLEGGALGQLVQPGNPEFLAAGLYDSLLRPPVVPARSDVAARYSVTSMAEAYVTALFRGSAPKTSALVCSPDDPPAVPSA